MQVRCLKAGANGVGIPDLIIAQNVMANNCKIFSLDKHFRLLSQVLTWVVRTPGESISSIVLYARLLKKNMWWKCLGSGLTMSENIRKAIKRPAKSYVAFMWLRKQEEKKNIEYKWPRNPRKDTEK